MLKMPLEELERTLRVRLAETLPGIEAQMRFAPAPPRPGWTAGHFPEDARVAAALLLIYPGEDGPAVPLTVRASGLARHAGQISLPGGAADPGETLARDRAARGAGRNRDRSVDRARARRVDPGARDRQRLHAAPGRRRHPRTPRLSGRRRGSGGDPRGLARATSATPPASDEAPDSAKGSRSSIPTSICSVTRSGARPP